MRTTSRVNARLEKKRFHYKKPGKAHCFPLAWGLSGCGRVGALCKLCRTMWVSRRLALSPDIQMDECAVMGAFIYSREWRSGRLCREGPLPLLSPPCQANLRRECRPGLSAGNSKALPGSYPVPPSPLNLGTLSAVMNALTVSFMPSDHSQGCSFSWGSEALTIHLCLLGQQTCLWSSFTDIHGNRKSALDNFVFLETESKQVEWEKQIILWFV